MLKNKIVRYSALLILSVILPNCYTQVELPKHTIKKIKTDENRIVNFTYTVIDTFYNEWLPDEGYYYAFKFDQKKIKEDKIDLFLNMLYAKGYNIVGAWYRPGSAGCTKEDAMWHNTVNPIFIILLSDFDDSIIQYDFYALTYKPVFECPFNVEEYVIE